MTNRIRSALPRLLSATASVTLLVGCLASSTSISTSGVSHGSARSGGGAVPAATDSTPSHRGQLGGLEHELLQALNAHRAGIGAGALAHHAGIAQLAREHNDAMASGAVAFGHDGFHERGLVINSLTGHTGMAENVSRKRGDASNAVGRIVEGWRNSARHKLNMENPRFTAAGVALVQAPSGHWFATALFSGP